MQSESVKASKTSSAPNSVNATVNIQSQAKTQPSAEVRLSLIVSPQLNETLEGLAESQHTTKSDVLRKAIALFDLASEAKAKDQRLGILDKDRKIVTEIVGL